MKRILAISLIFICVVLRVRDSGARDDWAYWNEFVIEEDLSKHLQAFMAMEQRLENDFGNLYTYNFTPGLEAKLFYQLYLGIHYQFEREKDGAGSWCKENRIELQSTLKWELGKTKFSDRNRFEYRCIDTEDKWRYRNRVKVAREIGIGEFKFDIFGADELFYDMQKKKFNQNRVTAGFSKQITKFMCLDIYYRIRSERDNGSWSETHILGTELAISFSGICDAIDDLF